MPANTTDQIAFLNEISNMENAEQFSGGHARLIADMQQLLAEGHARLDVRRQAAREAMFDELVEALAGITFEYRNTDSPFWNGAIKVLKRAKQLQEPKQ